MLCFGGGIREQTEKVLGEEMSSRGFTGRNTKRMKSNGVELDNTYEDCVKKRLKQENDGLTHFGADTRLCSSDKLIAAGNLLLCKDCAIDNRAKEVISADRALDKYANKI